MLAYLSDYCGGYGSLPTGTHYFSHSKHLIFPRYHCWYSCSGSNSKVLAVIFLIACKQLVRHLAQWHAVRKARKMKEYATTTAISVHDIFNSHFPCINWGGKKVYWYLESKRSPCFKPYRTAWALTVFPLTLRIDCLQYAVTFLSEHPMSFALHAFGAWEETGAPG